MKRRSTKKQSATALLSSPPPPPSAKPAAAAARSPTLSPPESPALQFDFSLNGFTDIDTSSKKKKKSNKSGGGGGSASKMMRTTGLSPSPNQRSVKSATSISDLKDLAASNLEFIKRHLERSHSEIVKDNESSHCRLQKRLKIQTQACQQVMDEAEKEYKKISERINEGREAMKSSYAEFIAEAQASASRVCKTSLPELSQAFEKGIASLRTRYGISSTTA